MASCPANCNGGSITVTDSSTGKSYVTNCGRCSGTGEVPDNNAPGGLGDPN